ncbi:hypothetical protein M0805_003702 [Coniferiporia weirii]|nr:hypothetical protein M0805_003702 [Coniferiporia weirii]
MCVPDGSVHLYTGTCPMCKVFRHPTRCPHKKETCRNRANHPRHDVVYITNAEVQTFNGCGYCKWAHANAHSPAGKTGMQNSGWPGCCRAPLPSETDKIPPADWHAVYTVHRTPIPADIKQLLDLMKINYGGQGGSVRVTQASERKALVRTNSSPNGSTRSSAVVIPQRGRQGSSPQMRPSSLVGSGSRPSAQTGASPGGNNASSLDHSVPARRAGPDTPLKRVEGFRTTPPATVKKLDGDRPPVSRPNLTATNLSSLSPPSHQSDNPRHPLKRRASAVSATPVPLAVATNRVNAAPKAIVKGPTTPKVDRERERSENVVLEKGLKTLSLSGASDSSSDSGSRSSGGSLSGGGTVTSDGGFTDYLSDESEAELQRQAVERAAVLEQNRMEEQEFRQARQQLASVDLRPPQAWTTGVTTSRRAANAVYTRGE